MEEPSLWWGLLPFVIVALFLLVFRLGISITGAAFLLATSFIAIIIWAVNPSVMLGALIKGILSSIDIAFIVLGSLIFLDVLHRLRVISSLEHHLHRIAPDTRIQALVLAWLFGALIEGLAGFGTPAVVVAPLLVNLGLQPISAVVIALFANTLPVTFGAVGTPIRLGMQELAPIGFGQTVAGWGSILAIGVVLLLAFVINREIPPRKGVIGPHGFSHAIGQAGSTHRGSIIPFAIWSAAVFAMPYYLISFFAPEFSTIFGSIIGLITTFVCSSFKWWKKIFLPTITQRLNAFDPNENPLTLFHTLIPYGLVVVVLFISKLFLKDIPITLPGNINYNISLSNPGYVFLLVSIFYILRSKIPWSEIFHMGKKLSTRMKRAAFIIACFVAATQLFIYSDQNAFNYPSILHGVASFLKKENFLILSPLLGAIGGFMAGSTTVSNILFSDLQHRAALFAGISTTLALCLQIFGATAGNSVSLSNIGVLEGTLNLRHQERQIIFRLIVPLAWYVIFIIAVAVVVVT